MDIDDAKQYDCLADFRIDTDGYTQRDREMFSAGFEFASVYRKAAAGQSFFHPIRGENVDRIRMMLAQLRIPYELDMSSIPMRSDDVDGMRWWYIFVGPEYGPTKEVSNAK